jgi:uncharacterized membrane protein YgdD (TMEM256/DUF423 family)
MRNRWVAIGACCCGLAVAGGALGAHLLAARLSPHSLALWETACRYLFYGGCGQVLTGLWGTSGGKVGQWAAACLVLGTLVFSGTVGAIALGGPAWLGAVTPLGGLLLIGGFFLLAISALTSR